jgi:hypothetical protein
MAITVTAAIARVRNYLDDNNNGADARWSDAEIRTALQLAADVLLKEVVQGGVHQPIRLSAITNLSSGTIAVPANMKIISVFLAYGNTRVPILPAGARNRNWVDFATEGPIEIDYVARNNVDFNGSGPITYGTVDANDPSWDAYLIALAAMDLAVKEGEVSPVLVDRTEKYRRAVLGTPLTGQVSIIPAGRSPFATPGSSYALYYYMRTPTQLQIYR